MNPADPNLVPAAFQFFAQHTHQVFFIYDTGIGTFSYLNPAFQQVWGLDAKQVQQDPAEVTQTVHPDDREYVAEKFADALRGVALKDVEFRINRPNGSEVWLCLSAFPMQEGGGRQLAGLVEDVTNQVEYRQYLRKFAAKKNSVLEILSHDLAGPLSVMQGLTTLVATQAKKYNDDRLNDSLGLINKTCKRAIHLIREFVKQEFLEASGTSVIKTRVDLVQKFREIFEQYKSSEENIVKTFHLFTSSPVLFASVDEVKFMQAINNLISNAIKFTPDNGVISLGVEEEADGVLVTVADNGIGIPVHLQDGLFDKFTKARRPGLRGEESVGLGMSIVKTIVDWHNGTIGFESEENKGTTFYIRIPRE